MDGTHLQALRVEAAEEIIGVGDGNEDAGDSVQTFGSDMRMNRNSSCAKSTGNQTRELYRARWKFQATGRAHGQKVTLTPTQSSSSNEAENPV